MRRSLVLLRAVCSVSTTSCRPGLFKVAPQTCRLLRPQQYSTAAAAAAKSAPSNDTSPATVTVLGQSFPRDESTNVTETILAKTSRGLHLQPNNPINIIKTHIEKYFHDFHPVDSLNPAVTVQQNFDSLLFAADHPGRALTDTYYINKDTVLRTHTSAHQSEVMRTRKAHGYLLTADVYRRDEIDVSHYPVFHQMEGIRTFDRKKLIEEIGLGDDTSEAYQTNKENQHVFANTDLVQPCHSQKEALLVGMHLRKSLEGMVRDLLGQDPRAGELQFRWISTYFPFTSPSWELEVLYQGDWLELLGCGVIQQDILDKSGNSDRIGWAFGLGVERIAMIMFDIPDIRLFWSTDERFTSQFESRKIVRFQPFSKYPACYKDISFWCPASFHDNDFAEVVRDVAGDVAEDVKLIDKFVHPKTGRVSRCFRINYRAMDRTLTNEEVDAIQDRVRETSEKRLEVELR
ncbi:hypothetical protein HDU85_003171 [Gaertneriomyces sp. JEL0708]|nr:hypothetical protein HDU85_003171 [Gaertneriomyces sp. JEL0708]